MIKGQRFFSNLKISKKKYHDDFDVLSTTKQKVFKHKETHVSSIVNTRFKISPIPFIITNADVITKGAMRLIKESKEQAKAIHAGGFNIFLKFLLNDVMFNDDSKPVKYTSFIIKGNDISAEEIHNKVYTEASKMYDTPTYYLVLHAVEIVISPLALAGGCNSKTCYKADKIQKSKHEIIKLKSLPSKNNNCIFACMNYSYKILGNSMKPNSTRKNLDIKPDVKIEYTEIPRIIDYYNEKFQKNYSYHVVNELNHSVLFKDADVTVNIYLRGDHYCVWEPVIIVNVRHVVEFLKMKIRFINAHKVEQHIIIKK